jgi:CubicO group peptidase (beta-lactamase class C family)
MLQRAVKSLSLFCVAFLVCFTSYSNPDSVYQQLSKEAKIALLFVADHSYKANNETIHPGFLWLDKTQANFAPKTNSQQRILLDLADGYQDEVPISFPNQHTLDCITDTTFLKSFLSNTLDWFASKGVGGVSFIYQRTNTENDPPRWVALMTDSGVCMMGVSAIEALPISQTLVTGSALYEKRPSPIRQHAAFNNWLPLFTKQPDELKVSFEELLERGFLFSSADLEAGVKKVAQALDRRLIEWDDIDKHAKRILALRTTGQVFSEVSIDQQMRYRYEAYSKSICLWQKRKVLKASVLELNQEVGVYDLRRESSKRLLENLKHYNKHLKVIPNGHKRPEQSPYARIFVTDNTSMLSTDFSQILINKAPLVWVHFGAQKTFLKEWLNHPIPMDYCFLVQEDTKVTNTLVAQAIFEGIAITGQMEIKNENFNGFYKPVNKPQSRIGFSTEYQTILPSDSLKKINGLLNEISKEGMAPGGQLLIAKDGKVIYNKPFGHTKYNRKEKVTSEKLYDLASITKVVGTMPVLMKLYEDSLLALDQSLSVYLPETDSIAAGRLSIQDLLLHETGLPSFFPFYLSAVDSTSFDGSMFSGRYSRKYNIRLDKHFYFNSQVRYRNDIFQRTQDNLFPIQVSNNLYMNEQFKDSMYQQLLQIELKPDKGYVYSDLGYYYLQKVIEKQTAESLDKLLIKWFTGPMALDHLLYKPIEKFEQKDIVPTENDLVFRKELIHGYVHDPGAAIYGGVAAHAGLFGNALDLALMGQMLLNGGSYAGKQYLHKRTIDLFTARQNEWNRRGLGFDKPELNTEKPTPVSIYTSEQSYGHSGFTGTLFWVDPKYDLIFVFLSNRIYPRSYNRKLIEENMRTRIQDLVYRSILSENEIRAANERFRKEKDR